MVEAVVRAVPPSQARLLALAIMPNHLHLVVQQGERPLSALMQPLLRRLAHLLQREHRFEGPVFWRPYAVAACHDPDHARNAIAYTNLNPVRAGLCEDPLDYAWTSHALYSGDAASPTSADRSGPVAATTAALVRVIDPAVALPLFATAADRSLDQLRQDYRDHVEWRLAADRDDAEPDDPSGAGAHSDASAARPVAPLRWGQAYGPLFQSPVRSGDGPPDLLERRYRPGLGDVARATLIRFAPDVPLELVKGRFGGARMSEIRHRMVIDMNAAGFPNVAVARFLGISESAVSKIVCAHRDLRR
ncbi:MAG TPA: hypothetical protein VMM12_07095 [Longimicrobiales bacterium]|nr:hypothetical protein [Longimicrobiales bacterium]